MYFDREDDRTINSEVTSHTAESGFILDTNIPQAMAEGPDARNFSARRCRYYIDPLSKLQG